MPQRALQYHPGLAPHRPAMHIVDLPPSNVRHLAAKDLRWRTVFWTGLGLLTAGTMTFATFVALA